MAVQIVSQAQVAADRYVADAQEYAGRITGTAQEQRERMLAEAEQLRGEAQQLALTAADAALDEPVPETRPARCAQRGPPPPTRGRSTAST